MCKKVHHRPSWFAIVSRPRAPKSDPNGVKPLDTSLAELYHDEETGETLGNDESDLHALKGKNKGKGFKEQCYHCGRVVECPKKDIDMMKGKGKNKALRRGKNPPQQQMLDGKFVSGYGMIGHGMALGPPLGKVRGSLEMALLCLDWK